MDQNDRLSTPKTEPSLDPVDAFAVPPDSAPAAAAPLETGDMPAWLSQPDAATTAPRWKRSAMWIGGIAVVVGLGVVGSQWLLQEHEAGSAAEINQLSTQAEQAAALARQQEASAPVAQTPVLPPREASPLPPLVLLPPEQGGKPRTDPAVAGTATAPPASTDATPAAASSKPATPSAPVAASPAPVTVKSDPAPAAALPPPVTVASPPKPTPAKAAEKVPAKVAATPAKAAPGAGPGAKITKTGTAVKPTSGAKPAPVKKKPVVPKRPAVKPVPKKVQGVTLPPPRERADEPEERPVAARKCIPGELARECEARLKQR